MSTKNVGVPSWCIHVGVGIYEVIEENFVVVYNGKTKK